MAWTAPATFTDGSILTGAQMNAISANLNETAPAKATTAGGFIVTTGANTVIQRDPASDTINTAQSTTSTTFVDLGPGPIAGPVTSGLRAIVWMTAQVNNSLAATESIASLAISGATTLAADDNNGVSNQASAALADVTVARCWRVAVTPGANTYTMKYRVAAGTGNFRRRAVVVLPG